MRSADTILDLKTYIWRAGDFVKHRLTSRNTMGHGVHSPYLFQIAGFVLPDRTPYYCFRDIEKLRWSLSQSRETVYVEDYGTGKSGQRQVCDVARMSLKPAAEAQLLMRLAVAVGAEEIVELGTSLGITTAYLANASSRAHVTTYEGAPELARIAMRNWATLGLKNIESVQGKIEDTLYIHAHTRVDMAFIDANHTGEALLKYFRELQKRAGEGSLFVLDDIHYSPDMLQAWDTICQMDGVTATMDLYSMGLVFFDPHLEKKTYRMRL